MIIVSGASGFIGRRLAARLVAEQPEADVRCLVKAEDDAFGQRGAEHLRSFGIQPIPTELVSGRGLAGLRSPDLLFHLAANTHTWESNHDCNDVGTERLIRALQPLGPNSHVVFKSTVAVMDNRDDLTEPLRSDSPMIRPPLSHYGISKWRAEEFLESEARRHGFRLSIVRCSTVYGRDPRPNSLFDVLKRGVVKGSLASRLNWPGMTGFIHVDDLVTCLLRIATDPPEPGETRTRLMATESRTLQYAARLVYRELGLAYRPVLLPEPIWGVFRKSHLLCRCWAKSCLPIRLPNQLWRFNLVVNPVLHCDTGEITKWFPDLNPRRMDDCIREMFLVSLRTRTSGRSADSLVRAP